MRLLAFLVLALALPACGIVYKIDVQQGNYVTQDVVAKLKKGMSKADVKQLLGTPLLTDMFHANRWDYYFSQVKGGKAEDRTRLSVFFEDDKLVAVMGDVRPASSPSSAPASPAAQPPAASAPPTAK
jgi:outer membrane protein assembly factor BamE